MSNDIEGGDTNDRNGKKLARDWDLVKAKLSEYISGDAFSRWFKNAELVDSDEQEGVVSVQSDMHQIWIETNYMDELRAAFAEGAGVHCAPKIVVKGEEVQIEPEEESKQAARQARSTGSVRVVTPEAVGKKTAFARRLKRLGINPEFDFESFVVGDNSQFAHAACSAVAYQEGRSFNPLFIHGRAGLGKTHLMSAVAQQLLANDPKAKVVFLTAEHFANEFIEAVRKGNLDAFRKAYRYADAMLIDDIQFLAGKERTQDEFFHTFNALLNSQTQVILTCDCPAPEIQTLDSRLISRFESGLTVELQPPGFETRVAILRRKMEQWKVDLDNSVVVHIANQIKSNVRRLEGALTRVASYSFLSPEKMSIEKVDELLGDLVRDENTNSVTVEQIQKAVADYYGLNLSDMSSRRRPASIAFPRQIAMFLTRKITKLSLVDIGESFGKRDHGTVIHACKKVKSEMGTDSEVRGAVEKLNAALERKN
ncbi:MAG: chromosomal replication initiator protein [Akkermansiaceae bacterium]|jgi:chromosomal replication initiator protein